MAEPGMEFQLFAALGLAIFLLIFLVVKTKVHAIVALVIAASVSGLIGGMMPVDLILDHHRLRADAVHHWLGDRLRRHDGSHP